MAGGKGIAKDPCREAARAYKERDDRAVYCIPVRDNAEQMDGWTLIPEADPVARVRAANEHHTGFLLVRVNRDGLLVINRPDEIEIDRTLEG